MNAPDEDELARLRARNAAMKDRVDTLLEQFERQTEQLREAQELATRTSAEITSPDGLVRATIDATGTLAKLEFASTAFERTTPAALAKTVLTLVRHGSLQVKQQVADLMAPLTSDMPDLSEIIEGAPSLAGLMPKFPDYLAEEEQPPPPPQPDSMEDPDADSILRTPKELAQQAPPTPAPAPRRSRPQPADEEDEEPPASWLDEPRR